MRFRNNLICRGILLCLGMAILGAGSGRLHADSATCGGASVTLPFMDVGSSSFFCQIAEAYFSGLTNGTSATTYSPGANVTRDQMAAFITRTQDSALRRGSERAALQQFWTTTPNYARGLGTTTTTTTGTLSSLPVQSDGVDLWVANNNDGTVSRVRGSDGKLLDTWTGATSAAGVLVAMGRVFVAGHTNPGKLYVIDPTGPGGPVAEVTNSGLGIISSGIAFDGRRIWIANVGTGDPGTGSVSIVTPAMTTPWSVTTVLSGFNRPFGILFDGSNIWVIDEGASTLLKLDQSGGIVQTVNVGTVGIPQFPTFDGTNIWVPNQGHNSVSVVRAATGSVIATLTGNGLDQPVQAAFDGQRILVTNLGSVSLWKAADLTPIGTFSTVPDFLFGACSDGTYFWVTLNTKLARF